MKLIPALIVSGAMGLYRLLNVYRTGLLRVEQILELDDAYGTLSFCSHISLESSHHKRFMASLDSTWVIIL